MTKEEVMAKLTELAIDMLVSEQHVFELSKKTLGSYVSKSASDAKHLGHEAGFEQGSAMAVAKSQGEGADAGAHIGKKAYKRLSGVNKAVKRLTKEDLDTARFPEVAAVLNLIK